MGALQGPGLAIWDVSGLIFFFYASLKCDTLTEAFCNLQCPFIGYPGPIDMFQRGKTGCFLPIVALITAPFQVLLIGGNVIVVNVGELKVGL